MDIKEFEKTIQHNTEAEVAEFVEESEYDQKLLEEALLNVRAHRLGRQACTKAEVALNVVAKYADKQLRKGLSAKMEENSDRKAKQRQQGSRAK